MTCISSAQAFTVVGVHPKASVELVAGYRNLQTLEAWNGKIYAGYGNDHMGPISIMPFDPVAGTFSNEYTAITEDIAFFRPLMGRLYAFTFNAIHYFRPITFTYGEADQPWTEENMLNISYGADIGCYNGNEIWVLANNHDKGTLWRSKDGGVTWAAERNNAWDAYSYNSDLGMANGKVYYSTNTASSWVYDGATWSTTPAPLGYMRRPVGFGSRLVYQSGSPGISSSYLKSFNGTQVTTNGMGRIFNFYTMGDKIYTLGTNGMVYVSTNLTNWTYIATAPASARSLTVLNGSLYVGTTNSEIMVYSNLVSALPTVLLKASDSDMNEGVITNTGTFIVSRTGSTAASLVVNYTTKGIAINGTDYTTLPGQITIPAGTSTANIVVSPINDGIANETNETVILELAASGQYEIGRPCEAVGIIYEKNGVTIQAIDPEGAEQGTNPIVFRISRTGSITNFLTVKYTLPTTFYINGGGNFGIASNGVDFASLSGSIVIPTNAAYVDLEVTPIDDTLYESDEGLRIQLSADAAYVREIPAEARARIRDNDIAPNRNLLVNPSFETDVTAPIGQPDSWGGAHYGSVTGDVSVCHSGQTSMRVNGPTPNLLYDYSLQNINLTPGKTYIVRGWIKTPGTPLETGRGPCLHYVQSPSMEWYTETVRECGDWKEVSMVMDIPTNHVSGRFDLFWVANEASLPCGWIDDLTLSEQLPNSTPPTIQLTGPTNGAVFTSPASIAITATASDSDGSVSNVEFFRDGSYKIGEDATTPYTTTWSVVTAGTYQITARATDNSGAMTVSTAATITVQATGGVSMVTLTANTPYGTAVPGTVTNAVGSGLTNRVTGSPDTRGTTQYVCTGWTMTGNIPLSGAATNFTMTLTNNAALSWLWQTNYWVTNTAGAGGTVNWTNGWIRSGSNVVLTAAPNNGYIFASWSGLGGAASNDNPFQLTVDKPYALTANFTTNALIYYVTITNNATPNGDYNSGSCWNGGVAPGESNNAVFDSNAIYRTVLSASVINSNVLFQPATVATNALDLNGNMLRVRGSAGLRLNPVNTAAAAQNRLVISNGTLEITGYSIESSLCVNWGTLVLDNVLATNFGVNAGIGVGLFSSYNGYMVLTNGTKVYHNSTNVDVRSITVGYSGQNGGNILTVYTNCLLSTPGLVWIGRGGAAQAANSMGHRAIVDGGVMQANRIFLGTDVALDMHNSKLIVTNGGVVRVTDWIKLGGSRGTIWCGRGTNHQVQVHSGWLMATNASGTGLIEITQTNSSLVINGGTVVADQVLETGDATRVTFNSGMLKLTGSGNTSRFNAGLAIPPGGTLEAVGTLAGGAVTNGGILSPAGDGVATTLRFLSNLVLASTSTNEIDMLTTAAFDQLDASGSTITCGGALVVTTNAGWVSPITGGSYTVLVGTVTGSFSQTNLPAGWTYAAGVVTIPALQCTLTVNSQVGQTQPSGVTTNNKGDSVTAMVTNTPVTAGTTQFVCLGWTGTGSAPASGSTTNTGAFTINTDSTVTWLWATNYWVTNTAGANGAVDWTNGWVRSGSAVQLTAMPNNGYIFAGWAGLGGAASNDNPFRLTVDKPYALTATFAARTALSYTNRATANGDYSVGANWSSDVVPNYHDTAVFASNATYRTVLSASVINSNVLYQPTTVATNALDLNGKILRVRGVAGLRLNPVNTAAAAQNRLVVSNGTLEITGYSTESSLCVNWGTLVLDNVLATNFGVNSGIGVGYYSSYNGYLVLTNGTKVYHNSTNVDTRSITVGYSGQNGGNILTVYTNSLLATPGLVWIGRGGAAQAASSMGHRAIVDGGVIQANRIFLGTDTAMDMHNSKLIVTNGGVVRASDWVKLGGFRGTTWCGRGTNHQVQVHSGWLVVTNASGTGLIEITQTNSALIINGGTVVADQILETGMATRVTFNSGVLKLTGNSNTSRFNAGFSVPAYATLEAVGTLWSPGTVTNAGTLSPAGAQMVGRFIVQTNLVLAVSSTNRFDVDASSANDQVDAGNKPVTLGGTLEIWVSPALNNATLSNATYYIITNAASYSGTFANISGGRVSVINNGSFAYATNGNRIVLNNYQGGMRSAPQRPPSGGGDGSVAWASQPFHVTTEGIVLQWQGLPTETYRILRTTNLLGGTWELVSDGVAGVAPLNVYTDLYHDAPVMFYRIETK